MLLHVNSRYFELGKTGAAFLNVFCERLAPEYINSYSWGKKRVVKNKLKKSNMYHFPL